MLRAKREDLKRNYQTKRNFREIPKDAVRRECRARSSIEVRNTPSEVLACIVQR